METALKTMRQSGAMAIAMGSAAIAAGVAIGVGCIVMGSKLLHRSK